MLRVNDIVCCYKNVDDDFIIFFISRVRMLKIIITDFKCSFRAIIDSEMMKSITSDFNCF